jgi:hypothetical protein
MSRIRSLSDSPPLLTFQAQTDTCGGGCQPGSVCVYPDEDTPAHGVGVGAKRFRTSTNLARATIPVVPCRHVPLSPTISSNMCSRSPTRPSSPLLCTYDDDSLYGESLPNTHTSFSSLSPPPLNSHARVLGHSQRHDHAIVTLPMYDSRHPLPQYAQFPRQLQLHPCTPTYTAPQQLPRLPYSSPPSPTVPAPSPAPCPRSRSPARVVHRSETAIASLTQAMHGVCLSRPPRRTPDPCEGRGLGRAVAGPAETLPPASAPGAPLMQALAGLRSLPTCFLVPPPALSNSAPLTATPTPTVFSRAHTRDPAAMAETSPPTLFRSSSASAPRSRPSAMSDSPT